MCLVTTRRKQNGFMTDCTHDKYRADNYMSAGRALAAIRSNQSDICYMGRIVTHCEECNADISRGQRVEVRTVKEVLNEE